MHFFIDHNKLTDQSTSGFSYGVDSLNTSIYNVTSQFQLNEIAKAFACQDSFMIVQQSDVDETLVNIILKPIEELKIPFNSVQYFVYRGIAKNSFFNGNAIKPETDADKSELLVRVWKEFNDFKTNHPKVSVEQLKPQDLGYDNSLTTTLDIEHVYDYSQPNIRPIYVKEGEWIGNFAFQNSSSSPIKIGFEIIQEANILNVDLQFLRAGKYSIDVSELTGLELRAKREQILSFVDSVAFFGLHYEVGVSISTFDGTNKSTIKKKANELYPLLLEKFATKNRIYLDIRSEHGYSYNFYQNYNDGSGNNIKIGNSSTSPTEQNYSTNDWPIVSIDSPIFTTENNNDVKIQLRIDDNIKPILFLQNTDLLGNKNNSRFIDEKSILNGTDVNWSKELSFYFPNTGTGASKDNLAYYIKLHYFRQEYNPASPNTVLKNEKYFNNLFGCLSSKIFDSSNIFGWIPFNEFIHTSGNLPQEINYFGNIGTSGCYFDSDSVVFYIESIFQYKSTKEPYPLLTASIVFDNPFFKSIKANSLVVNYDLYIEPNSNNEITAINIDKYESLPYNKGNLFFIILKKDEYDELNGLTGFSSVPDLKRYISFDQITDNPSVDYLTDLNGNKFYKYKLKVSGIDALGIYHEEYPENGLIAYSGDGLAFASMGAVQTKITKSTAWSHQQLWNDIVINQNHIKNFGSDYFSGMKYKDGLTFRIKSILEKRLKDSQIRHLKIDCADLCLSALIEYASFYGLPLLFKDYRDQTSNRVLNSKNTQYNSKDSFDLAVRKTYGAASLFSSQNFFLEDVNWKNIRCSDLLCWKYILPLWEDESKRSWHASTISELTNDKIITIQGSLDNGAATYIEQRQYDRDSDNGEINLDLTLSVIIDEVKAKRWKFSVFDNA